MDVHVSCLVELNLMICGALGPVRRASSSSGSGSMTKF